MKSMTAYGRAAVPAPWGRLVVELHSVNRKHLEINTFLPKELLRYDADIKKWVGELVLRGQVNVKISAYFEQHHTLIVRPNLALAKQLHQGWKKIVHDLRLSDSDEGFMKMLSTQEELFQYEEQELDPEACRQVLQEAIAEALQQLMSMKIQEGRLLKQDISDRFARLPKLIMEISLKAPHATLRYRQRLLERLNELGEANLANEERLLREVCIYAERLDIAEELTRFDSHLHQVEIVMHGENSQGKTLEFLVQELNREINTIASKSSEVEVSRHVIEIKSELERIREQIQNIE